MFCTCAFFQYFCGFLGVSAWIFMQLLRKIENGLHKALYFFNVKSSTWKLQVLRPCNSKEMIKPPNKYTCESELKFPSLNILAMHGISIQFHAGI
jgi:hypothetical protein